MLFNSSRIILIAKRLLLLVRFAIWQSLSLLQTKCSLGKIFIIDIRQRSCALLLSSILPTRVVTKEKENEKENIDKSSRELTNCLFIFFHVFLRSSRVCLLTNQSHGLVSESWAATAAVVPEWKGKKSRGLRCLKSRERYDPLNYEAILISRKLMSSSWNWVDLTQSAKNENSTMKLKLNLKKERERIYMQNKNQLIEMQNKRHSLNCYKRRIVERYLIR